MARLHTQKVDSGTEESPYEIDGPTQPASGFFSRHPEIKILYLIGISVVALSLKNPYWALGLLALQFILWIPSGFQWKRDARFLRNSLPFVSAIVAINTLFEQPRDFPLLSIRDWDFYVSSFGFFEGLVMAVRFYTVLAASGMVRSSMNTDQFVTGLTRLRVSKNFALVLDYIFANLDGVERGGGGGGGGGGHGQGQGQGSGKKIYRLAAILKGDFSFITESFQNKFKEAQKVFPDPDWAVICAMTFVMVALRLVKILPGLPFAPGFKNAIFIPLFIATARLCKKPFAATIVGIICGMINYLFGFGKYGVLGILQFTAPGFLVDILVRLHPRGSSILWYGLIGLLAGISRVAVETGLAILFGLPSQFYLFYSPIILTQCGFGAASAPLSKYLEKHLKVEKEINHG